MFEIDLKYNPEKQVELYRVQAFDEPGNQAKLYTAALGKPNHYIGIYPRRLGVHEPPKRPDISHNMSKTPKRIAFEQGDDYIFECDGNGLYGKINERSEIETRHIQ